jgi:hypothetical protein
MMGKIVQGRLWLFPQARTRERLFRLSCCTRQMRVRKGGARGARPRVRKAPAPSPRDAVLGRRRPRRPFKGSELLYLFRIILSRAAARGSFMKIQRREFFGAIRDNFEIWKVVLPILLGGFLAGLAIFEFAFRDPFIFLGWSVTCLISGGLAHRWWARQGSDSTGEWS